MSSGGNGVAYVRFRKADRQWFVALIEGMVKNPQAANIIRVQKGIDLEVAIVVAPADQHIFTPEVCQALRVLLGATVSEHVSSAVYPVVYLHGKPHPEAKRFIKFARTAGEKK